MIGDDTQETLVDDDIEEDEEEEEEGEETLETLETKGKREFLEKVKADALRGRPEGSIYPNYIEIKDNGKKIRAHASSQCPNLELVANWIPIPFTVVGQEHISDMSNAMLGDMAQKDPAFMAFPIFTSALYALLYASPDERQLNAMEEEYRKKLILYGEKKEDEVMTTKTLDEIYDILAHSANREFAEGKMKQMEGTDCDKFSCLARMVVSLRVTEKIITSFDGLNNRLDIPRFRAKARGAVDEVSTALMAATNKLYSLDEMDGKSWGFPGLVKQILDHGTILRFDGVIDAEGLCNALIEYNMSILDAHEHWFFTMLDIPGELRFYHSTLRNAVPNPFMVGEKIPAVCIGSLEAMMRSRIIYDPHSWDLGERGASYEDVQYDPEKISLRWISTKILCNIAKNMAKRHVNDSAFGLFSVTVVQIRQIFSRSLTFEMPVELVSNDSMTMETVH